MARACAKRLACPSLARVCDAHRWVNLWMKHQAKLKIATFDPKKEIVILTDYAAVYEMKGKDLRTCEHGPTCNQLVALVLHSPEPQADCAGPERKVQCDYWRFWSNEKGNAEQHDMAMREIAEFYKFGGPRPGKDPQGSVAQGRARQAAQIPDLETLSVWSDGQRSQYKGEQNFGRMSIWPKSIEVLETSPLRLYLPHLVSATKTLF